MIDRSLSPVFRRRFSRYRSIPPHKRNIHLIFVYYCVIYSFISRMMYIHTYLATHCFGKRTFFTAGPLPKDIFVEPVYPWDNVN